MPEINAASPLAFRNKSADSRIHSDAMPRPDQDKKTRPYHATMLVTRAEEWCVDAASPEEAKALLEKGEGHRCAPR